jgi:hypothetical protein
MEDSEVDQKYVESKGHVSNKAPRYHCELQFIEQYWGAVKLYLRSNCDYTLAGLRETIATAMLVPSITSIRRYYTRSKHMMDAYRLDISAPLALYITKKYKGHRRLNNIQIDLAVLQSQLTIQSHQAKERNK